jgi:hypothetical protein
VALDLAAAVAHDQAAVADLAEACPAESDPVAACRVADAQAACPAAFGPEVACLAEFAQAVASRAAFDREEFPAG